VERPRGVADVSSMHMVLNNQISLNNFYASRMEPGHSHVLH